jgi:crotonobetainyl-CoA:carnitine CoA-transferase CaiB-like acyl-CoA transferase
LFDGMADWMNVPLLYFEGTGVAPARIGLAHPSICPYGAFDTRDGASVLISIQNEREWAQFCASFLEEPELPAREGFRSNVERVAHRPMVDAHIAARFAALDRDACAAKLTRAGIAYGFVNGVDGLSRHPALRRVTVETERGPVAIAAPAARFSDGERALGPVPALGAHDAAIRAEFAA